MSDTTVAAVIVAYNNPDGVINLLSDLRGQTVPLHEIIVIDNDPEGAVETTVRQRFPDAAYTCLHENTGSAGGFHEGIRQAAANNDFVWTFDDDVRLRPSALEGLLSALKNYEETDRVGAIGAGCFVPGISEHRKVSTFPWKGTLLKTTAINEIGLPLKELFLYSDDVEYALRLNRAGYAFYSITDHSIRESRQNNVSGRILGSDIRCYSDVFRLYYAFRNEINVNLRYARVGTMLHTLCHGIRVMAWAFLGIGPLKGMRQLRAVAQGIFDGFFFRLGKNEVFLPVKGERDQ